LLAALGGVPAALADWCAAGIHAVMEADAGAIIKMDVVHSAAVRANAARVGFFQVGHDLTVLALGWMEIYSAAGCVVAGSAGTGNAGTPAVCRDDLDGAEL